MNVMMLLEMAAQAIGPRAAVQCENQIWSLAQLFAGAGAVAQKARALPVQNVALLDTSSPALPLALFGAGWAGRPFAPLNYRLTGAELNALLARVTPALLITDAARARAFAGREGLHVLTREALLAEARAAADAADPNTGGAENPAPPWSMDPEEIAVLLFTSGTTGAPKAAVLRHRHLVSYILGSVEFMAAAESEAALVAVPPYHVAGLAAVLSSVYAGRRVVQLPNFAADEWLRLAAREGITNAFVVPTMLARILEAMQQPGAPAPSALRALAYGGGKMPQPVIARAMRQFPAEVRFTNAYGLTETSSTIAVLGPEEHRAAAAAESESAAARRLGSAGKPLPGVEVEIRDEEGRALPAESAGEIWVRGEQVSGEYLGRTARTAADGWFPTNDGGWLDAEGYLFVSGRLDDVIVRGGENLSPGEIEDALHLHEGVADCAVVGIPDERWGEAVGAVVVRAAGAAADTTAEELQAWVKEHLRSSRAPQRIEFWPELPYNETGKLLRRKVRAALAGE